MRKIISSCLIALFFSLPVYSGGMGHASHYLFVSVSAGPYWANPGTLQTITLQPDVIKTYVPKNSNHSTTFGYGEIFLGVQKSFFQKIQSQFGLVFNASSPVTLKGFIQEDGNPNFQNYVYQYKISHQHIDLKTKWIFENALNIDPYCSASIGLGINHSYGYTITPLIFQEIPAPPFSIQHPSYFKL